jgi:hypothetical protein|tara:strand:+ start:1645 stop:2592 length:948 start_codon:yes stop_codon:yes gene_type:complete
MAKFAGSSTYNFALGTAGQTNGFFIPEIYSKKVQIALRKAAVAEAICNTDYMGEISSFGDTVNIIKEPQINVADYSRGLPVVATNLSDQELVLTIDQAKSFSFKIDDLEKRFSHVNFQAVAADNAAYALRDAMDSNILEAIGAGATVTTGMGTTSAPIDIGFGTGEVDPLNQMSLAAKELDEANAPEDGRWFVAAPEWYNQLANTSSKLLSVDFNAGQGSVRNGLVASGLLRGFQMYKSNNVPTNDLSGATPAGAGDAPMALFGHISGTSAASAMNKVETVRDTGTFSDIVRGLMVWGRKVLRPEITGKIIYTID